MKKILVWAYLKENLGDDLFIKMLLNRYPQCEFYIINNNSSLEPFKRYMNIYMIEYQDALKSHKSFDGFIDIGGSIFQFHETKLGSIKKRVLLALLMKLSRKKNFVLGANFGPYKHKESLFFTKLYFLLCEDVCLRDQKSYQLFKNLKNVRIAPDIVFNMDVSDYNSDKKIKTIGISVIDLEDRKGLKSHYEHYVKKMIEVIEYFLKRQYQVTLISFCTTEGDTKAIKEIVERLNDGHSIETLIYDKNIDEFLLQYSQFDIVIACRFHSFILSNVFKQKTFSLIYSDKLTSVLSDLGLSKYSHNLLEINKLDVNQIDILLQEQDNLKTKNTVMNEKHQFIKLDSFLGRK